MILKPDILIGPYSTCAAAVARDTTRGLLTVYAGPDRAGSFETATSERAVDWGIRNITRKAGARGWYTTALLDRDACIAKLEALRDSPQLNAADSLPTAELTLALVAALGFTVTDRWQRTCDHRDYLGLYARNTHFSRLAEDLRGYLVDKPVEILLLAGAQEPSALHVAKELLRRVVRYPTSHYDALENLVHVSDPGSTDHAYFEGARAAERGVPRH
jgi:hypothetical protein